MKITMKLLTGILLVVGLDLISGAPIDDPMYWDSPVQFCGSTLPVQMAVICRGWYNDNTPKSLHQLMKRGIVDECCKIPCTRRFLKNYYCAAPPKQTTPKIIVTTEPTTMKPTTTEIPTTKPTTTEIPTTTSRVKPVDYNMYYFALVRRVQADYPKDFPIQ